MPGVPLHITQRGNNRSACFFAEQDYLFFLEQLKEQGAVHGCAVHAFCLMTNHVHLLVTPEEADSAARMMKALGQRYVQYVNRCYGRSGTLWEGRFRSCLVSSETYLLVCQRYIELNPVRAGMVAHPGDYRWSSYRANAQGEMCSLLAPHAVYRELGIDLTRRRNAYRDLFRDQLPSALVEQIRFATNGNFSLGLGRFSAEIERTLGRRVTPGKPGRPRKNE